MTPSVPTIHLVLLGLLFAVMFWSAWGPADTFTWALETFPAFVGGALLLFTYRSFRFTTLVYGFIVLHASVLFVGGHYTYANEPVFNWLKETFHLQRNNFDKVGHFLQGFVPTLVARELYSRHAIVRGNAWINTLAVATCLSVSLLYELLEWLVAVLSGTAADAFLGTQGAVWDTQSDMLFALIGGLSAILFFARMHNRAIARIGAQ